MPAQALTTEFLATLPGREPASGAVSYFDTPRRPPKVPHLWPPKLLHPAGGDLMH